MTLPPHESCETVDPARSALMARVRDRNTTPEMVVRRVLFANGYRYRLHARDLPGRPDIVFRRYKKVIFVHGCFWHRHAGCNKTTTPKIRRAFWVQKFNQNKERDAQNERALQAAGWSVLTIWECETKDREALAVRLIAFIKGHRLRDES